MRSWRGRLRRQRRRGSGCWSGGRNRGCETVAGASVTAFDDEDDEVTSTATGGDGTYVLGGLPAGTYRVEVSANGFEDAEASDVSVTAAQTTENVDVILTASP